MEKLADLIVVVAIITKNYKFPAYKEIDNYRRIIAIISTFDLLVIIRMSAH